VENRIRIPLIILLSALAVWLGYDMFDRTQQAMLWGMRPLFFFLSIWSVVVLLAGPRISPYGKSWRWLGLSTLSGLLLSLGFPDVLVPFPFLMFVGFVPLLWVEKEISEQREKPSKWELFKYSYHAFVVWNIITTYWVANTGLVAGVFAILVNSALMCIPFLLFHQTKKAVPGLGYLAFIAYWVSFEYGHLNWELTWPWLTLGNSFAEFPAFIQWYEYTGVFGGTLWILLMNVLLFQIAWAYQSGQPFRRKAIQAGALVLLPVMLSLWMYATYEEDGETAEVVVVQPNYEPHYEKFNVPEPEQVRRYIQLTAGQITESTDYVVFPETSFGWVRTDQVQTYPAIERIQDFLRDYPKVKLVTGVSAYRVLQNGEPLTRATRTQVSTRGDTTHLEVLNAAAQLTTGNRSVQWYYKSKLVPGAEIFPFRDYLWFFAPLVQSLDGTWEGFGTQAERSVFKSEKADIGPAICYESVFGEYFAGYVRKGANAVFIMTNDGWWDNTAGHRQHLHFASLRAIETRRSIARSANTGISAFIDERGRIHQATEYDEPAAIKGEITLNDAITFYVRWGDAIARLSLFVTILLLLNTLVKGITGKRVKG
jgi:apolipoprotein N-acyltransferase